MFLRPRPKHNTIRAALTSFRPLAYRTSFATASPRPDRPSARFSGVANPRIVRQSAVGSTGIVIAVGVAIGCAALYTQYNNSVHSRRERERESPQKSSFLDDDHFLIDLLGMPSQIQPGRPGNLTPDQEAKLRETWELLGRLYGVADQYAAKFALQSSPNGVTTPLSRVSTTEESVETIKKKKRFSVFRKDKDKKGRKDSDADSLAPASVTGPPSVNDIVSHVGENDKHGQTKVFKDAMAQLSPEDIRNTMWDMTKHDHPDALMLRFLRARKWDIQAALVMMISTMHWRLSDSKVDSDIMLEGEEGMIRAAKGEEGAAVSQRDGEDFMTQIRMGKSFMRGVDKEGRPMCVVRVRLHRGGEQTESSLERFTVYTIETGRMFLKPPVDTATLIFDMTDFSLANMDYTPVKFMIKCFEANYPESLGAVLIHKAPWIFSSIWTIIKGWLDPVVASKIHFTKNIADLEHYVPKSNIIKELGGEVDWEYKYVEPLPHENDQMKDTATRDRLQEERMELVKQFEEKTIEWILAYDKSRNISKAEQLHIAHERDEIAKELRENYWQLDPYVRARSLYDRTGLVKDFTGAPDMDDTENFTTAPSTPMKLSMDVKRSMDLNKVNGTAK